MARSFALAVSVASTVSAFQNQSLPEAAAITSCNWDTGAQKLVVQWSPSNGADYYEVRLASAGGGEVFAIYSTKFLHAEIEQVLPGTTYAVSIRSHNAGSRSLGPGTWGLPGNSKQCTTGSAAVPLVAQPVGSATSDAETFAIEVQRESEYTRDIDYLMNHASGDLPGDAALVTAFPDAPWADMRDATFTLYCVDLLKIEVSGTITPEDDHRFADYISCNMNSDHSDPQCDCDFYIDRSLAGQSTSMCHSRFGGRCGGGAHRPPQCVCDCSSQSTADSSTYTGMSPVRFGNQEVLGHWYSHPTKSECAEDETLGDMRGDGTQCTWKRRKEARVVYGHQVQSNGFRAGGSPSFVSPSLAKENAVAFRKTYDQQPMKKWSCSGPAPTPTPTPSPPTPTPMPSPSPTPSPTPGQCHAISSVVTDDWCIQNCAVGFCPSDLCECDKIIV